MVFYPLNTASGGGSGTVTSISNSDSTLTLTPNPITGTGTVAINLGHQNNWTAPIQVSGTTANTSNIFGGSSTGTPQMFVIAANDSSTGVAGDEIVMTPNEKQTIYHAQVAGQGGGGTNDNHIFVTNSVESFSIGDQNGHPSKVTTAHNTLDDGTGAATLISTLNLTGSAATIVMTGSSTGKTTIATANAGASNFTITCPAATGTVMLLGTTQTVSGAITFSGTVSTTSTLTVAALVQTVTAMGAQAVNGALGNVFTRTLAGSETFTQSGFTTGQCFIVEVTQGSGTSYTVTWFSGVTWVTSGATAPTQTTTSNGITTYAFRCTGSNTFLGYLVGTQ